MSIEDEINTPNLPAVRGVGYARANWGRWVVDCPRAWCTSALAMLPYDTNFMCYDCGFIADTVYWPHDVEAIQVLLNMRPVATNRNWEIGETLNDLLQENIAHDIMPNEWRELAANPEPSQITVMRTIDERVVGGLLLESVLAARTEINRLSWMNAQEEIGN